MARELKQLIPPQQLTASATVLYTVPANRTTTITVMSLTNTTATDRYFNLWIVPSGDTAADDNKIYDQIYVASGETFSPSEIAGQNIPAGTTIQMQAEVIAALTVLGSGAEITN